MGKTEKKNDNQNNANPSAAQSRHTHSTNEELGHAKAHGKHNSVPEPEVRDWYKGSVP